MTINESIIKEFEASKDRPRFIAALLDFIRSLDNGVNPVNYLRLVPLDKVVPNDYNPNTVARNEMRLLYISIKHDGYIQPIVTIYDKEQDRYVIVDGFHRYLVMKTYKDIYELNKGLIPCVVIDKDINDRMASTIRHNRARGKHSVTGVSDVVFKMLQNKWKDEDICNEIGLEPDELVRLKHITGFSKLFEGVEYGKAWETKDQMALRNRYHKENGT